MGNYYAAGTDALSIHDNLYYLWFEPGRYEGAPAEVLYTEPEIEGLTFINHMKTGRRGSGDKGYIYSAPGQYEALLRGTIPADGKPFSIKGVIPEPALFCARYFYNQLQENNINVIDGAGVQHPIRPYEDLDLLLQTTSPPVSEIVHIINKRSFNLYAEQLIYHLALQTGREGTRKAGISALLGFLNDNDIDVGGVKLYDGSGLSRTNRITAKSMVQLLKFATGQTWYDVFNRSLAVTGDSEDIGNFKRFGRNTILEKNARVKSGLITGVRSLSGYMEARSGRKMAFSLIVNNFQGSSRQVDRIFKNILVRAAEEH
jgi:D-alanyl-D-alanine carboxypeptidase/D-alanyl-D-alanine-endopeptidase (penicillin-binding protein 4)